MFPDKFPLYVWFLFSQEYSLDNCPIVMCSQISFPYKFGFCFPSIILLIIVPLLCVPRYVPLISTVSMCSKVCSPSMFCFSMFLGLFPLRVQFLCVPLICSDFVFSMHVLFQCVPLICSVSMCSPDMLCFNVFP